MSTLSCIIAGDSAPSKRRYRLTYGAATIESDQPQPLPIFADHSRDWERNAYVYPVISRRSGGLSIGVNLNPDTACNFDCIYCQVDRTKPARIRDVDPVRLESELIAMLQSATSGELFTHPRFANTPQSLRRINDIAFSGDGEPTTCPIFADCVRIAATAKQRLNLPDVRIVLITDACYLTKPAVQTGLRIMDDNNGEIWAKLDAGTQTYYELVNRPNYPLSHVMENIIAAAAVRPIRIQSLFMNINGEPPDKAEIDAYIERLREITSAGGTITEVQIYTVARQPAESYVTALTNAQVDNITDRVQTESNLFAKSYYSG